MLSGKQLRIFVGENVRKLYENLTIVLKYYKECVLVYILHKYLINIGFLLWYTRVFMINFFLPTETPPPVVGKARPLLIQARQQERRWTNRNARNMLINDDPLGPNDWGFWGNKTYAMVACAIARTWITVEGGEARPLAQGLAVNSLDGF